MLDLVIRGSSCDGGAWAVAVEEGGGCSGRGGSSGWLMLVTRSEASVFSGGCVENGERGGSNIVKQRQKLLSDRTREVCFLSPYM